MDVEQSQMDLEEFKKQPLYVIGSILREAYKHPAGQQLSTWYYDHVMRDVEKKRPEFLNLAKDLFEWGRNNQIELEILLASRSPSTAAKLAVSYKRRLCPEAEKFVTGKAGDRATLLEYCGKFGIVLDELTKVTMKAAFNDEAHREKRYIKKLEATKRVVQDYLTQMINIGRVDPNITVQQLIESLV